NGGQDIYTSTSGTPPVPTASFSLIGVVTGSGITPDATDLVGANPMLGPLQNNGGPTGTPTMAPAFNSPVIDQGKAFGSTTDGRGLARPVDLPGYPNATGGDGSDIGAVELQAYEVVPVVSGLSASSGTAGTPVVISGTRLSTAVGVLFGSTPATFKANSSGQLVATVPAGAGTVDVRVITPGGESSVVATDKFTYPTAVTPPVTPPASQVTSAKFGNQTITLTTPSLSACTAKTSKLSAKLTSAAVAGSKATKLRFSSAGFFIDRGVKHVKKKTEHLKHGKTKKITVTTYTANTVVHHVPATVSLKLTSLKSGSHTLKVVVSYRETVTKHHHKKTVTVTKTISSKFKVC
ncbi:MAG TPA: IPT/TIG domain-containing protein, partial [Polyangiaceae bacterium]